MYGDREELAREFAGGDAIFYEPFRGMAYQKADALLAAGWRKKPSREDVAERVIYVESTRGNPNAKGWAHVSEAERDFCLSRADAILALLDGPTETGGSDVR